MGFWLAPSTPSTRMCQKSYLQKYEVPTSFKSSTKKNRSNLHVSTPVLSKLRKLPVNQITTAEGTSKTITTNSDNPPTHHKNYKMNIIDDIAPQKIEEN